MTMNGSNGHSSRIINLEEQRKRDLALLKAHLMDTGPIPADLPDEDEAEAWKALITTQLVASSRSRHLSDDEITVHASNVSPKTTSIVRKLLWLRPLFVDLPLCVIFLLLVTTFCVRHIYHEYYVPLMKLSARTASDLQLMEEYTYYDRECSVHDLTSATGKELLLKNTTSAKEAVDNVMLHGSSIIPQVLDPETVKQLRKFIVRRNGELTKAERIPLSQGKKRVSFGIDATEDPIVAVALEQISKHPILPKLLAGLVGSDPAVTEITAITASYGAPDQAWHPDVKPDGNALKFARTYSHSYSLFIPLQDTTSKMGATTLCPGTHYCANELEGMCERYGYQLSEASPDGLWHSGDGAILSQQVWHRGAKHTDKRALERVVFIVSFIGRPDATRQLSRGTYFHMKWLTWGHTFQDLSDAHRSMAKPFSILRSLSIWKPAKRNWGYDLMTASVMRIANGQNGMEPDDVSIFQTNVIEKLFLIPKFLQGRITGDEDAWATYLSETIEKVFDFLFFVNAAALSALLFILVVVSAVQRSLKPIRKVSYRILWTHGATIFLAYRLLNGVRTSEWGRKVKRGAILRPPFPPRQLPYTGVSAGPTTVPSREDVLVGTRFDATYLGAYDRWLEFHPGNRAFDFQIQACILMPTALEKTCIDQSLKDRRLLEQDWTTGDWRIMTAWERRRYVRTALNKARNDIVARFSKSLAILIAYNRFDVPSTFMNTKMLETLEDIRNRLHSDTEDERIKRSLLTKVSAPSYMSVRTIVLFPSSRSSALDIIPKTPRHPRWTTSDLPDSRPFEAGDMVWVNYNDEGTFFGGVVWRTNPKMTGAVKSIIYKDGEIQKSVPTRQIVRHVPLEEGAFVSVNNKENKDEYARVTRVRPNDLIDLVHSDGEVESRVSPKRYSRIDL